MISRRLAAEKDERHIADIGPVPVIDPAAPVLQQAQDTFDILHIPELANDGFQASVIERPKSPPFGAPFQSVQACSSEMLDVQEPSSTGIGLADRSLVIPIRRDVTYRSVEDLMFRATAIYIVSLHFDYVGPSASNTNIVLNNRFIP